MHSRELVVYVVHCVLSKMLEGRMHVGTQAYISHVACTLFLLLLLLLLLCKTGVVVDRSACSSSSGATYCQRVTARLRGLETVIVGFRPDSWHCR